MIVKQLLLWAMLCLSGSLFAQQTPGYLGKMAFAEFGLYGAPNLNGRLYKNINGTFVVPENHPLVHLNTGITASVGYTLNRRSVIVGGIDYKSRSVLFPFIYFQGDDINGADTLFSPPADDPYLKVNTIKFNIGGRRYKQGSVAPIGRFLEFGFSIQRATLKKGQPIYKSELRRTTGLPLPYDNQYDWGLYVAELGEARTTHEAVTIPALYIGAGRRKIISGNIFIDWSMRFHLPLVLRHFNFKYNDNDEPLIIEDQIYLEHAVFDQFPSNLGNRYKGDDTYTNMRLSKYLFGNEMIHGKIAVGILF